MQNIVVEIIRKQSLYRVIYHILFYFISVILLFSGISKIIDPLPTVETLKAAFKLSDEKNLLIATALPIVEISLQ